MTRKSLTIGLLMTAAVLAPAVAFAATGYISGRTTLRAGPDPGYPAVDIIHRGEGVEIHGCLRDWTWCDVGFNGARGWLPASKFSVTVCPAAFPWSPVGEIWASELRGYNLDEYWDTHYNGRFDQHRGKWQTYYHDRDRPSWSADRDDRSDRDRDDRHHD